MNMKANKYLMGLVVALAGLTSCNTDVEGDYYSSDFANVSFDSKGTSVSLKNTESTATIPVRVTRAKTEGAYTATYTAEASAPGVFTESGNGTVSFADGEGSAIINVTANNVEKEVNYTYTLNNDDPKVQALLEGDEKTGANIILKALEAPLFTIAANAGLEGAVIVNNVKEAEVGMGYDALNDKYVKMVDAGILDPVKVTRSALQNATSVASTLLTTESCVATIKEPVPAAPAAPGMGGMM